MILAVTNTTLLSNFAHARRPDLPPLAFPGLVMPGAVREEIEDGVRLGFLPALDWSAIPVVDPDPAQLDEVGQLKPPLDRGEIACLATARSHEAIAVTDDRDARKVAQALGLEVSGTLGALILLVRQRHLTLEDADRLLATMIAAGYRSPKSSIASFL
ncbi:MAG: twitching motility protein PilT [bacterium]|nr:twitching motility protein PilT [bacterium]